MLANGDPVQAVLLAAVYKRRRSLTAAPEQGCQLLHSEGVSFVGRGLRNPLLIEAKAVLVRVLLVDAALTVLTGVTLPATGGAAAAFANARPAAPCSGFWASAPLLFAESGFAGGMSSGAGAVSCSIWPFGWTS